jgi:hypothetical protein
MLKFGFRVFSYSRYKKVPSHATMLSRVANLLATENQFSRIMPDQLVTVLAQAQNSNLQHKEISFNIANHISPYLKNYSLQQALQVYTYVINNSDPPNQFQQEFEEKIAEKLENVREIGDALNIYCHQKYTPNKILTILKAKLKLILEQKSTSKMDLLYLLSPVAMITHNSVELASGMAEIIDKHMHELEDKTLMVMLPYALLLQKKYAVKIDWTGILNLDKETLIKIYPVIEAHSKEHHDLYSQFMKKLASHALSENDASIIKGLCKELDKLPEMIIKLEGLSPFKYAALPLKECLEQYVLDSYNKLSEESKSVLSHKVMEYSIFMTTKDIIYVLENKAPLIFEDAMIEKIGNKIVELASSMSSYEYTVIVNKLKDSNFKSEKFWEAFIMASEDIKIEKFHEVLLLRSAFQYLQIIYKYSIFDQALASIDNTFYDIMKK